VSPQHRLVILGDSLSQGFQSFAIYNTHISYPAMIAGKLGLSPTEFRYPSYKPVQGPPDYMGPALNLEYFARKAGDVDCTDRSVMERIELLLSAVGVAFDMHSHWDAPERIDELGLDAVTDSVDIVHNLAIAGFDVDDLTQRTADIDRQRLNRWAEFTDLSPVPANGRGLISLPVLRTAKREGRFMSTVDAARTLGNEGGIETLIVFIGANNALGTVLAMNISETVPGYEANRSLYNLWRPDDFKTEYESLAVKIASIKAEHVLLGTVPHVTVAPLAHGVLGRSVQHPQFFNWYTYPWIPEDSFVPGREPCLSADDAMKIDQYIDSYNDTIRSAAQGRSNWHLVDICGLMDSLAYTRYWDPDEPDLKNVRDDKGFDADDYVSVLPPALRQLTKKGKLQPSADDPVCPPDSRFFRSDGTGRSAGGLVALDGVHPSTIGYGVIAQTFLDEMKGAGVDVGDGQIDFKSLVESDSLVSDPPRCVDPDLRSLGWGWAGWDWVAGLTKTLNKPRRRH
jgi:hypothetical protein